MAILVLNAKVTESAKNASAQLVTTTQKFKNANLATT